MADVPRDYYEVLGISRDADQKAIKDAFRALALQYHPDRNKAPGAEEKFKEIAAAYAVLSDPDKRRAYDARGFAGVAGFSEDELFRTVDFGDLLGGLGIDLGDLGIGIGAGGGGLFERWFGRRRGSRRGQDVEVALEVPLARVVTGGEEEVVYRRSVRCAACRGSGAKDGTRLHRCTACDGTGRKVHERGRREVSGEVLVRSITTCQDCGGRGEIIDETCPICHGAGAVEERHALMVEVPIGVEDEMVLRIPAHGMPADDPGGRPGDLLVLVRTAPDPRFERRGADLWRREVLSVPDAVLGTTRTVPTLDGSVEVTIPAAAQPGLVLRIARKGLPVLGGRGVGDLYVHLDVRIPEHPSARERELYAQLRALATPVGGASVPPPRTRANASRQDARTRRHRRTARRVHAATSNPRRRPW